jgi:3-oxoacyl-[acyl-carrier protein] reductase
MKLKGRGAIITGANQGLGEEIAGEFVRNGASVVICARDAKKLSSVKKKLKALAEAGQKVLAVRADISREADVKRLISAAVKALGKVDIMVNNAGVYGPKGPIEDVDSSEWADTIKINLIGTFYCCKHIMKHMKHNGYGKIINLSGGGATSPLPYISAYAASKAAVVRLTETLAEECRENNVDVNSVAPGALNTRLLDEVIATGPEKVGKRFFEKAVKQKKEGGAPLQLGASLCVFLASAESDGISGRLISAQWDPWKDLRQFRDELAASDIYTLRRIVPEDRGKKWVK